MAKPTISNGARNTTLFVVAVLLVFSSTSAREDKQRVQPRSFQVRVSTHASDRSLGVVGGRRLARASDADTFVLAEFSFDEGGVPSRQGWTSNDATAQLDTFFHVADASELDGGSYGYLLPLEGNKSMWCGATYASHPEVCSWVTLPGYGNNWTQFLTSIPFPRTGDVTLSYLIRWDMEGANLDPAEVTYRHTDGYWRPLLVGGDHWTYFYDGQGGPKLEVLTIPDSLLGDSIQVRFRFRSDGAWSDEDGRWPSDGALIIDSLTISDANGVIDFQDFEAEPLGAHRTNDGHWQASGDPPYGDFSGLFPGMTLLQEDPCVTNNSGVWAFIRGSTDDYSCGGHPEQTAIPFGKEVEPYSPRYLNNEIWSPPIDWELDKDGRPVPATASRAVLEFDVYRDLPLDNLVFYNWSIRGITDGCGSEWRKRYTVYWGQQKDWFRERFVVGDLFPEGANEAQIALGAWDACGPWCNVYGSGECHSHAPLIDNVRLIRFEVWGPEWIVEPVHLFQDNFASDGTKSGTVRIDMAADIAPVESPAIIPGDSVAVTVTEANVGLDYHLGFVPDTGPAVYCHVKDISPAKRGAAISGDRSRWPAVSTGDGWTVLRFDTVRTAVGDPVADRFCVDLNDDLYTPGDTIWYYFSARDTDRNVTYWSQHTGTTDSEAEVRSMPIEATCLPANALNGSTEILYVDDFDNHGAQPAFDRAFDALGLVPDRYDVLAPSSVAGNGPGARVVDVLEQITSCYQVIIWNTGDLSAGLLGDGSGEPEKSDDFALLHTFLKQSPNRPGLYISGDNVTEEWVTLTGASAIGLRSTYVGFDLVDGDHAAVGQPLSPPAVGQAGSAFEDSAGSDRLVAFGGCPTIGNFDVMGATGSASVAMTYSDDPTLGAVVTQVTQNAVGDTARVILSGFSYHRIRDDEEQTPDDQVQHLLHVLRWLGHAVQDPGPPPSLPTENSLAQNYPNPFNPSTTIRYSIRSRARVVLKIYNVAGQLVRTLADGVKDPVPGGFVAEWDGQTNDGKPASSGVYFYQLETFQFTQTKKMVLVR
jgi:hypothetical protein